MQTPEGIRFGRIFSSDLFAWVVLPIIIILARMIDVTLGDFTDHFCIQGQPSCCPHPGAFRGTHMDSGYKPDLQNISNPLYYFAYALGFALSNYLGIMVEEKLAIGFLVLRIFVLKENPGKESLMEKLIGAGFGVTTVEGRGSTGEVTLLYSLIRRKDLDEAVAIIEKADSRVFYSIEPVKAAHAGIFPAKKSHKIKVPFIDADDTRRRMTGNFRK